MASVRGVAVELVGRDEPQNYFYLPISPITSSPYSYTFFCPLIFYSHKGSKSYTYFVASSSKALPLVLSFSTFHPAFGLPPVSSCLYCSTHCQPFSESPLYNPNLQALVYRSALGHLLTSPVGQGGSLRKGQGWVCCVLYPSYLMCLGNVC